MFFASFGFILGDLYWIKVYFANLTELNEYSATSFLTAKWFWMRGDNSYKG